MEITSIQYQQIVYINNGSAIWLNVCFSGIFDEQKKAYNVSGEENQVQNSGIYKFSLT